MATNLENSPNHFDDFEAGVQFMKALIEVGSFAGVVLIAGLSLTDASLPDSTRIVGAGISAGFLLMELQKNHHPSEH